MEQGAKITGNHVTKTHRGATSSFSSTHQVEYMHMSSQTVEEG